MAELEEEEEEAGCYTAKKKVHMYHHSVMPCSWLFDEPVHNSPKVARISRWDELCEPCFVHNSPIVACISRWDEPCVDARPQTP